MMSYKVEIEVGFGFGSILAALLSYSVNHSIFWGFIHAICGWLYVIYYIFVY